MFHIGSRGHRGADRGSFPVCETEAYEEGWYKVLAFMLRFSENKEQRTKCSGGIFQKVPREKASLVGLCPTADVLNISDAQNTQIKNIQLIWDQHLVSEFTKEQHKGTQGQDTNTFLGAYPDCETVSWLNLASPDGSKPVNLKLHEGKSSNAPNQTSLQETVIEGF